MIRLPIRFCLNGLRMSICTTSLTPTPSPDGRGENNFYKFIAVPFPLPSGEGGPARGGWVRRRYLIRVSWPVFLSPPLVMR